MYEKKRQASWFVEGSLCFDENDFEASPIYQYQYSRITQFSGILLSKSINYFLIPSQIHQIRITFFFLNSQQCIIFIQQMDAPETLKSRLYKLETVHQQDTWVQKCQGFPIFKKEDNIFKLKYYSLPNRELFYEITVNSNIKFDKNQNGVQWIQIKQGQIMAISFKEEFSANAFWKMIDQYQRKYEVSVPAAIGTHFYFQYRVPDPTVDNLPQFLTELEKIPENQRHQRLTSILLTKRQFLPHLCSVFRKLEACDPQDINKLQTMFKIIKIIFNSSNEQLLYELVMEESFYSVLGALQYDPNFRKCRTKHRDYVRNKVRMIPVVNFRNNDLLSLCYITQRIEYIRQCVLLPYLNDYSFAFTSIVIRNNYKRIISQIFNQKKKEFINELFDHLRKQEPPAYKLLREIFRIGKTISSEDFYLHLAERDFFDIMIKNIKDLKQMNSSIIVEQVALSKTKKKKKPEDVAECVDIGIQVMQQFMEYQPLHFKNYCISQSESVSKYPTINFLFDHYESLPLGTQQKFQNILKLLIQDNQNHPIKGITHKKILTKFLSSDDYPNCKKWIQLVNKIVLPFNVNIDDKLLQLLDLLLKNCRRGPKQHQINMLQTLKILIDNYIDGNDRIMDVLVPRTEEFSKFFIDSKGSRGIRLSIYESIFKPKKLGLFVTQLIKELQKRKSPLMSESIKILKSFLTREEVVLPTNLKRERSEQLKDDESFEKIEKKIKID